MRWKTSKNTPPRGGDKRTHYIFAWKPTKVEEYTVWLERYAVYEVFFQPAGGNPGWWSNRTTRTLDYYC